MLASFTFLGPTRGGCCFYPFVWRLWLAPNKIDEVAQQRISNHKKDPRGSARASARFCDRRDLSGAEWWGLGFICCWSQWVKWIGWYDWRQRVGETACRLDGVDRNHIWGGKVWWQRQLLIVVDKDERFVSTTKSFVYSEGQEADQDGGWWLGGEADESSHNLTTMSVWPGHVPCHRIVYSEVSQFMTMI
jgi:hypothetical protein